MTQFYYPPVEWVTTAFASQLLSIITLWPVLISQPNEGRKLSWLGWLFTHQDGIPVATNDHPLTTNCVKCRIILLMCAMSSSLGQIAIEASKLPQLIHVIFISSKWLVQWLRQEFPTRGIPVRSNFRLLGDREYRSADLNWWNMYLLANSAKVIPLIPINV